MTAMDDIREAAVAAAREAGAILMAHYGKLLRVDAALASDLKLEIDRLCEKAMLDVIRDAFPDHAVLSEEAGVLDGDGCVWYVDPLDGTVNYYHGLPYFCTTLACYRRNGAAGTPGDLGEPLVGVTYAPLTGDLFVAVAGGGLTLNGEPARIREERDLADCLFISSIGNDANVLRFTREVTLELSLLVRKTRNMGARAYDLANAACGRASGFFEYGVKAWDIAAGKIQVEEAGGRFSVRRLADGAWLAAASGRKVHDRLLEHLNFDVKG